MTERSVQSKKVIKTKNIIILIHGMSSQLTSILLIKSNHLAIHCLRFLEMN